MTFVDVRRGLCAGYSMDTFRIVGLGMVETQNDNQLQAAKLAELGLKVRQNDGNELEYGIVGCFHAREDLSVAYSTAGLVSLLLRYRVTCYSQQQ
jgi:hypothetical protein